MNLQHLITEGRRALAEDLKRDLSGGKYDKKRRWLIISHLHRKNPPFKVEWWALEQVAKDDWDEVQYDQDTYTDFEKMVKGLHLGGDERAFRKAWKDMEDDGENVLHVEVERGRLTFEV
jgi:hypothetical protein